MDEAMSDIQFKYELRKCLRELERRPELLQNKEYERLQREYLREMEDIRTVLRDESTEGQKGC